MKKSIVISLIVAGVIIGIIFIALFLNQKPSKDATGEDFNNFYTSLKEEMCCENCLNYGVYDDSKDCLEIIKEHGGIKHCYLIMENYPHTYAQCKQHYSVKVSDLKICPDEWIQDEMLGDRTDSEEDRQYYIMDGKRHEISEFDNEWVKNNCDLERQFVY